MSQLNKHHQEGLLKAKERDFQSAVELYNLAIEIQPDNADVYSDRGVAYYHLKKLNLSLMDMDKALELDSTNPYRYASRAYIKDACGDTEGAIADYKRTIELDPEDAIAFNNLGLLEEKLGRQNAAKVNFKKADELADKLGLNIGQFQETQTSTESTGNSTTQDTAPQNVESSNILKESAKVFTDKNTFREFVRFVKNGFK